MNALASTILGSITTSPQNYSPNRNQPTCSSPLEIKRRCDFHDMHKELVPYAVGLSWQRDVVNKRKALIERNEDFADNLIVLQHKPVYTLGAGSSEAYLNFDRQNAPLDVFRTERGGEVTYHGPGQLVMYPVINLRYHNMDLHWYLRALEEVIIRALSSTFSIEASRIAGLTGVWVGDKKLAAIGIKVSQWVTYHGLALNVTPDLTPFHQIVPCGIQDRQVGSIKGQLCDSVSSNQSEASNNNHLNDHQLIDMAYKSLVAEFSEVFQVDLHQKSIPVGIFEGSTIAITCKNSDMRLLQQE